MSLQAPPYEIWFPVNGYLPGVYDWFLPKINAGLRAYHATPTSWWRSQDVNESLGGARASQHLLGLAVDVVGGSAAQWRALGLVVVDEGDHIHLQAFPAGLLEAWGVFSALGLQRLF